MMSQSRKIVICNVPLRSEDARTVYPPLGAMYVTQALKLADYDTDFYDINLFRPSDNEIESYFLKKKPHIVGISATVSTSYAYTKKLAAIIRKILPHSFIVVGGAITASSDILLKFTEIDFCVIGEGEVTIARLVKELSERRRPMDNSLLKDITGLCFLDPEGRVEFTGYEAQIPMSELPDPDYEVIRKHSKINQYIIEPWYYEQFLHDPRSFEKRRKGKRLATVVTSRGCVARCTFCHRWQKGLRIFTVDRVMNHIQYLMEQHNVGFISFGDEDFGASKKWVDEFIEKIASLNILYRISATRVDHITPSFLKRFRESGCIAVHYGFESGSNRMLKVMEKRTSVEMNTNAALWTHGAQMQTVPGIVLGMPGETYSTLKETTSFLKKITEYYPYRPKVSPNLLVALPGTPVYEYARMKGFLGKTMEDEERYLLRVSDHGGESYVHFNFTDVPYFIIQSWVRCVIIDVIHNHYKKNKIRRMSTLGLLKYTYLRIFKKRSENTAHAYSHPIIYHLRYIISALMIMYRNFKTVDRKMFMERCLELFSWPFKRKIFTEYISLREFMNRRTKNLTEIKAQPTNIMQLKLGR